MKFSVRPQFVRLQGEQDMQAALAKMASALEGHISMEPSALTEQITVLGEDYARQNPDIWLAAARAAQQCARVRMRYQRFDGQIRAYEIEPLHLASYHGEWYL
ncbi:MAG: WYL domain-containing protein, partial [Candidatus Pacebacteria bacterium]|nr:WYL domain-containing protein [Candidatus Paceibacterota bacterium]